MDTIFQGDSVDWTPPNQPLGPYLLARIKLLGDRTIHWFPQVNEEVSASTLADRTVRYAGTLQSLGVQPGDKVVTCCGLHPHYPSILLATICCGAGCATLNHKFDSGDLGRLLEAIQPKVIFALPEVAAKLQPVLPKLTTSPKLIIIDGGETWEWFTKNKATFHEPKLRDPSTTVAAIMCSSGTSGLPKGVLICHANIFTSLHAFRHKGCYVKPDDIVVITSPLFWITALLYTTMSMDQGLRLVFENGASEEHVLTNIKKHQATILFTATNFALSIAKHPSLNSYDISSLRIVQAGGAAMTKETELLVARNLGVPVKQMYGMTEILVGTGLVIYDHDQTPGSVGPVVPTMKLKIIDPDTGHSLGQNKTGEILFKGPLVTLGYINNTTATEETFDKDGWVHSGDVGHIDSDGNIFVTSRIKDIIKYRGEHVSPADLEAILLSHSDVLEAAIVGVPHPTDVEHPRAYVVLRPGAKTKAEELVQVVANQVAEHKWLRGGVHFLESLPKSVVGKVNRNELRKLCLKKT